jgi:hypothetical protein
MNIPKYLNMSLLQNNRRKTGNSGRKARPDSPLRDPIGGLPLITARWNLLPDPPNPSGSSAMLVRAQMNLSAFSLQHSTFLPPPLTLAAAKSTFLRCAIMADETLFYEEFA